MNEEGVGPRGGTTPPGHGRLQLRYETGLTGEGYVRAEAWRDARLDRCPNHPHGECSLARHGTYARKTPRGTQIARWYCPESHTTFSLLPDCLSARLPGELDDVEAVVAHAEGAASVSAAANALRRDPVGLPGAIRWVQRRVRLVHAVLVLVIGLLPEQFERCVAEVGAVRARLETDRFFRTLRAAWLERLDADATSSLEALNRSLWAWVEGEYHQSPHRGIDGRTPLEQWALAGENVRYPGPDLDLDDLFLFEAKRRVMKDRTVSLHGRLYEVDAILVGQSITLRHDPQAPASRPLQVRHDGRPAGEATRLDAYANTVVKRDRSSWHAQPDDPAPEPRPSPLAMQKLKEKN